MKDMFQETRSKYDFGETLQRLNEIITVTGWRITHTHDMQETMIKNDYTVLPLKVIELCNPSYAYRILSEDDLRLFSSMMPCRISVYEKEDGHTYISRMNNGVFAAQLGGIVSEVMGSAYKDAEGFIKKLVE